MTKLSSLPLLSLLSLLLLGGGCLNLSQPTTDNGAMMQDGEEPTMESPQEMSDEPSMEESEAMEDQTMMAAGGSYQPYAPEKLAAANTGDVVLFFRASWCPTCKALDADIQLHLNDIPENLTILDVDYDTASELKKKYGVTYQHTLVQVDAQGNLIKKWSGSPTLAALTAEIE